MSTYGSNGFVPGDRVELSPATDYWMAGAKFATVVRVLKNGTAIIRLDHRKTVRLSSDLLRPID